MDGQPGAKREGRVTRRTRETTIEAMLDLDGTVDCEINTGIGFFDHMLESLARHAAIGLRVAAKGDLHIDMHHTVEDVGIVIGQTLHEASGGSYAGLTRFGCAHIPMDETLVRAAIDLCGRPYLCWKVAFERDKVGAMDTELFKEFFHALAVHGRICLHLELITGENCHHIAEACFKAVGRALREAARPDPRLRAGEAASTKGSL